MSDTKAVDLFGIKPFGDAFNTTVSKSLEGVEGFLKIVCAPALEEVGLMLRDQVRQWRLNNILRIITKAQGKLIFENGELQIKAHPRVILSIIENGSLNDDDEIQELWAGLFVSSCTKDGQDDENLIFVDLLKQLTAIEAKILKFSCENAHKILNKNGLLTSDELAIESSDLFKIIGIDDIYRLDRELDHLRSLELIGSSSGSGGFTSWDEQLIADISPTSLALNLYIKSHGYNGDPSKFWKHGVYTMEELNIKKQREREEVQKQKNGDNKIPEK
ncbi:hypothetical protein BH09BAC1_BH09BAC1_28440 [soil metagenome]